MDRDTFDRAITTFSAGSIAEGIEVSMDIEQLIYDAGRLHDAAALLGRIRRNQLDRGVPTS